MLTSGIVLAIMVIPFIASVMREVFMTVPTRLKESAYALGSTKWEVSWDIVLPYTRSAVIGGIFLGLGRALGETMAVAFVIGNSVHLHRVAAGTATTIAALIANDFGEATEEYRSALLLLGFVLFIVTFVVLALARLMLMQACPARRATDVHAPSSSAVPPPPHHQRRRLALACAAAAVRPGLPRLDPVDAAGQGPGRTSTWRCSPRTSRRRWKPVACATRSSAA